MRLLAHDTLPEVLWTQEQLQTDRIPGKLGSLGAQPMGVSSDSDDLRPSSDRQRPAAAEPISHETLLLGGMLMINCKIRVLPKYELELCAVELQLVGTKK